MPDPSTERYLALKVRMMPHDTNPHGTIFGGVLLSGIDQAGAVGADHEIHRRGLVHHPLVTVAMNSVEFHRPVYVGDVLSFLTTVVRIGRTSITMHVAVEAERNSDVVTLTEADVTYVAVEMTDGERRPVPLRDG
jgi:acyl-CoA thioesterase YciA